MPELLTEEHTIWRHKVRLENMVIETTSDFAVRLIEIIWDMFFANKEVSTLELDNPEISQLKKATLSKFFLILEAELREIVKTKQKLVEEIPRMYNIIYKIYRERKSVNEHTFREHILTNFREHMWVDDLVKIIIDWFTKSLDTESVYN